LDFFAWNFS